MKIYIKYMVSIRCKMVVKAELDLLHVDYTTIDLGAVDLKEAMTDEQMAAFRLALAKAELEVMDDKKAILIEKIKNVIVEAIHYDVDKPKVNISQLLVEKLNYDYNYMSNLFSEVTGVTIEFYVISHKIERVKELLIYDELNLTQISYLMNYSSVAHLSNQFKKVTGLTPTFFKKLKNKRRIALDDLLIM